jgi:peptidoglycan/LPS O-acetylase OafA/YrhL
MTGIIFKGLDTHSFSILKFYIARANRIIPALAILCLFLILFGWFFLYSSEYNILAKHVRDSLYFMSNHTYWLESGYLDAGSHEKWLLHTWSLSAE